MADLVVVVVVASRLAGVVVVVARLAVVGVVVAVVGCKLEVEHHPPLLRGVGALGRGELQVQDHPPLRRHHLRPLPGD